MRQLFGHVEGLGEVGEVRLKHKPGAYRSYGFVSFGSREAADKAVKELNNVSQHARTHA